ncbi:MAG TPA: hypothetical protein VLA73_01420, partial [Burkholderiales bacterium]|nr:hypothetical protein [Burkholderiales bacterium]
ARLRAKLREYYEGEGRSDAVRLALPKGSYAVRIEFDQPGSSHAEKADAAPRAGSLPIASIQDKPSVVVLPFVNMSPDSAEQYFADGLTEDLTTELTRLSGLFVISRHSAFAYRGTAKRVQEIARELGVGYLVEGSVRRSGERVRVSAQLIDAAFGAHLWAERYDRELQDIFALQDDVTRSIASVLKVKLTGIEKERVPRIDVHDCLLRGLERFWNYSQEATEEARALFAQAVKLDPAYAPAHAWLARALVFQWIMMWDPKPETLDQAFEHARTAVDLDERLAFAHSVLGWIQLWRRQAGEAIAAGLRALALDSNNADGHLFLACSLAAAGRGDEALPYIEMGMRLNPHPSALSLFVLGYCYYVLEEYDNAVAAFTRGAELRHVFYPPHYYLCLIYTLLGRDEEARAERETLLALTGGRRPFTEELDLAADLQRRTRALAQLAGLPPIHDSERR